MGSKLAQYINKHIAGNVYGEDSVTAAYETDGSIVRIRPRLVAMPNNTDDVRRLLNFANQLAGKGFRLPVAVRGAGLDKTGADLTDGMVISMERMTAIKAVDTRSRLVHIEAGVTLGDLNAALRMRGLWLPIGADPRETIGGLIANAPTDDYAAKYGGIMNYVQKVEVAMANGERVQLSATAPKEIEKIKQKGQLKLYRNVRNELKNFAAEIKEMKASPDSSGYAGAAYVERGKDVDLSALLYGSQGTLAVVTEVILRLELLPERSMRVAVKLANLKQLSVLNEMMGFAPKSLAIFDTRILKRAEEMGKDLGGFAKGDGMVAVAEFVGSKRWMKTVRKKLNASKGLGKVGKMVMEMPENEELFENFGSALKAYLNDGKDRTALLDGVFVPNKRLADFVKGLSKMEEEYGVEMPMFGSFAAEAYNVRPELMMAEAEGRKKAVMMMSEYANLVKECEGSLTGGTPEGRVKAMVTNHRLSERQKKLAAEIKEIFDPNGILNPDIKTFADTRATVKRLRQEPAIGENS